MSAILLATLATVMFLLASTLTFFADFPWFSHLLRGACTVLFPFLVVLLPREKEKPKKEGKKDLSLLFLVPAFVGITFGLSLLFQWIGRYFGITLPTYRGRLLLLSRCCAYPALSLGRKSKNLGICHAVRFGPRLSHYDVLRFAGRALFRAGARVYRKAFSWNGIPFLQQCLLPCVDAVSEDFSYLANGGNDGSRFRTCPMAWS